MGLQTRLCIGGFYANNKEKNLKLLKDTLPLQNLQQQTTK